MIDIYKIGGNVINNPNELRSFLKDFASLKEPRILVHGGGKEASELGRKVGLEPKLIDGRRVTDRDTLDLVTMVYAGLINKRIVSLLQEFDCDAVGLTGADGNVIPAHKRIPVPIDFGYVGDIDPTEINVNFISTLFGNGNVPVFCAICRNPFGGLLNCNADSIAAALAVACSEIDEANLIYCFEKPGVLTDLNDDNSLIPLISGDIFDTLVDEGKISGGMIPKVSNALKAVKQGVASVVIRSAVNLSSKCGTVIKEN